METLTSESMILMLHLSFGLQDIQYRLFAFVYVIPEAIVYVARNCTSLQLQVILSTRNLIKL